ncbi:MAG: RNA 2',3'-cyclic phosphodiesterase [Spirochaetes bacterium]|nr:RNA 2',3'-cyclic phosphodiesterase [Spirochaetota bacterium]
MRVFAALPIPSEIKEEIAAVNKSIKKLYSDLKIVDILKMHITLHFFGGISDNEYQVLADLWGNKTLKIPVIKTACGSIDFFPPSGKPRVIYLDLNKGSGQIISYRERLEKLLTEAGFKKDEKIFKPHITLARNKFVYIDRCKLQKLVIPEREFVLDRLVLYQSVLHREGPEYKPLKTVYFE